MRARLGSDLHPSHAALTLALVAALTGCGEQAGRAAPASRLALDSSTPSTPANCAASVLDTLARVARRVYHQGISSERTIVARRLIGRSTALREAVSAGDPRAARGAAAALLAGGKLTNLRLVRGGRVLTDVGAAIAFAPFSGTITGSGGTSATYTTSVWNAEGLLAETHGLAEASVAVRAGPRTLTGSPRLRGTLPPHGSVTSHGMAYQYTSLPVALYPTGSAREYLFRSLSSTSSLCGASEQDTVVNTLSRIARRIYEAEGGRRTLAQVHRAQHDQALLDAVARRDPAATRAAVSALLTQHIVRLRVSAPGGFLVDVGGPDVLAPVGGRLVRSGREIGSFLLAIQDDEGYLRLTRRLVGLRVLMHSPRGLVKNDLGPNPGAVPASGSYSYRGQQYRVFTFTARAFPAGPLVINVLIPIPYS